MVSKTSLVAKTMRDRSFITSFVRPSISGFGQDKYLFGSITEPLGGNCRHWGPAGTHTLWLPPEVSKSIRPAVFLLGWIGTLHEQSPGAPFIFAKRNELQRIGKRIPPDYVLRVLNSSVGRDSSFVSHLSSAPSLLSCKIVDDEEEIACSRKRCYS